MQIQVDRKKWLKNAAVLLAELVLILAGLVLVGTVGERGFDNWKIYFTFQQEKQNLEEIKSSANDLIQDEDGYITCLLYTSREHEIASDGTEQNGFSWFFPGR